MAIAPRESFVVLYHEDMPAGYTLTLTSYLPGGKTGVDPCPESPDALA
jgi:hypothetical protein